MWDSQTIKNHKQAAILLNQIMADIFTHIHTNAQDVDEYLVQQFILEQFHKNQLKSDTDPPIVAFGPNTQNVHYFPEKSTARKLNKGDLIMIDIWARLDREDAPFADITWMGYHGEKVPAEIMKSYELVIQARDEAVKFIQTKLGKMEIPTGKEIDDAVRKVFADQSVTENFPHTTGHSLGFDEPHGKLGVVGQRNAEKLYQNVGYTIEPGLYFAGKFGFRSEIDFYIDDKMKLTITTDVQKDIKMLS